MNKTINYISVVLLLPVSFRAVAAEPESIRHEIEVFLSSGIGSVVSIILLILLLLWLLLPLAVFGLKSKLNRLTSETREANRKLAAIMETNRMLADTNDAGEILGHINETNSILADIREELSVLNEADPEEDETEQGKTTVYEEQGDSVELYDQIKYDP